RPAAVARPERPEDALPLLLRNPGARIGDGHADRAVARRQLELDATAGRRPVDRVPEQVRDDLEDTVAVGHEHGAAVERELVVELPGPRLGRERGVGALAEDAHVDLLAEQGEAPRVELREVEHVADEALEADGLLGHDVERAPLRLLVVDYAFPQRGDMAADRGQRRPQLVRDGHQEVARQLLRLRELRGHLPEPRGEPLDLAAAAGAGQLDVVATGRDLVRGGGERLEGTRDAAREVDDEETGDRDPDPEGDGELPEQLQPAARERRVGLRDDNRSGRDPGEVDDLDD